MRSSLIERGFALGNRKMVPAAGITTAVRYTRGVTVISDAMRATFTAQQVEMMTAGGSTLVGRRFNWQLHRDDLQWGGASDLPRRNDVIEWTLNGRMYLFTVITEANVPESGAVDVRSDWIPANVTLTKIT